MAKLSNIITDRSSPGLKLIVPTSVAVGSGTGSADSLGTVTFNAISSVSLNGIFSSTYENYRIVMNTTSGSGNVDIFMRLRFSGSDNTTTNYEWTYQDFSTTTTVGRSTGDTKLSIGANSINMGSLVTVDLGSPFNSTRTNYICSNLYGTGPEGRYRQGQFLSATSFDGVTIYLSSGTMIGTLSVYGYNQ
jgi:hypothetical protein